jgi:DNA mismatch endonuclease, patch repair protein
MADHLSPKNRSLNMSLIKSKNTLPEIRVRSVLHRLGFRFRKNVKKLSGTPDIVLRKYNTVIFVHGCFWHCHEGCKKSNMPKSNTDYWKSKFEKNVQRDINNQNTLTELGWNVFTVWECETKDLVFLEKKLLSLFEKNNSLIKNIR